MSGDVKVIGALGFGGMVTLGGGAEGAALRVGGANSKLGSAGDAKVSAVVVIAAVSTIGLGRAWANLDEPGQT